jgi:hypothetical protein
VSGRSRRWRRSEHDEERGLVKERRTNECGCSKRVELTVSAVLLHRHEIDECFSAPFERELERVLTKYRAL